MNCGQKLDMLWMAKSMLTVEIPSRLMLGRFTASIIAVASSWPYMTIRKVEQEDEMIYIPGRRPTKYVSLTFWCYRISIKANVLLSDVGTDDRSLSKNSLWQHFGPISIL